MEKIIWSLWFQGRDAAPPVVRACLRSWEDQNPGWELRVLDARTVERYAPVRDHLDLERQRITAASLSDIIRICLLREFGGVWVDATVLCNRPLDEWLTGVTRTGFFAFDKPGPDRPLASWFLYGAPENALVSGWHERVLAYWSGRVSSDDYFWFHHCFGHMCDADPEAAEAWRRVTKVSADGPHAPQLRGLLYQPNLQARDALDRETPVFKLTHRIDEERRTLGCWLSDLEGETAPRVELPRQIGHMRRTYASLKVSTENLGDHIQIAAGLQLLARMGIVPNVFVDRDNEIRSAPVLENLEEPAPILLNGWFKTNQDEWPPSEKLAPLVVGFHMRPHQCPSLLSEASFAFLKRRQPIGCRDLYTLELLAANGVEAFESNCLSLSFPRRAVSDAQTEIFVVSRDERLRDILPASLSPHTFINHYSGTTDFTENMRHAYRLLSLYSTKARLIVTTLLHCALPAIAMGIPVIVFYPLNTAPGRQSDIERFSSLCQLLRVYDFEDAMRTGPDGVDWDPGPVDLASIKLQLLDTFYQLASAWAPEALAELGPITAAGALPPPG